MFLNKRLEPQNVLFGEEGVVGGSPHAVLVMIGGGNSCVWHTHRLGNKVVFLPATILPVDFLMEFWVVDMKFVWADPNNWSYQE